MGCSGWRGIVHVNRVGKYPVLLGGYYPGGGKAAKMSDRGNASRASHVTIYMILFLDAWTRRNQTTESRLLHALVQQPPILMRYAYSP